MSHQKCHQFQTRRRPGWMKGYVLDEKEESELLLTFQPELTEETEWHEAIKNEIKAQIKNETCKTVKKKSQKCIVYYKLVL